MLINDLETGVGDQVQGVTGEVAPVGKALLEWIDAVLPSLHTRVGRETVLEEVQLGAGAQYAV